MSKNAIDSRYSIEYTHPGTVSATKSSKKGIIISLLFLGILAAGFYLWKQGFLNRFQEEIVDIVKPMTEKVKVVKEPIKAKVVTTPNAVSNKAKAKNLPATKETIKPLQIVNKIGYSNKTGEEIFLDKCSYCHGKKGEGNLKDTYPKLQGQHSAYLVIQLKRMRDGNRLNANPAMFKIIQKMDNDTLLKISNYIAEIPSDVSNTNQVQADKMLQGKLNALTNQLLLEKKKSSQLALQLQKNLQLSNSLAKLYGVDKSKVNNDDQDFMKVVQGEKNRLNKITEAKKKKKNDSSPQQPVSDAMASSIVAQNTLTPENNNTVEISTTNQIDKIISAIKTNTVPSNKSVSTKRVYVNADSNIVQKSIGIQNKINQLVSAEAIPQTKFTKALKSEDKIRKNSVRSIKVKKGETLWSIATRAYGNGFDYPKILKANPKLKKGKIVLLRVGQVIRVPK